MPTLTLQDLSNRVYARLDGNTALYPQAQVTDSLNEQIRVTNLHTGFLQASANVPGNSVANQAFYNVPAGILATLRVQFNGVYLGMLELNELGQSHPYWASDTTASTGMPVTSWTPFGLSEFIIWPSDSVGNNTITVVGIQEPVLLVNSGDVITMPNEQAEMIDRLAFNCLTLKETGAILQQSYEEYKAAQRQIRKIQLWQGLAMPSLWNPEGRQAGKP